MAEGWNQMEIDLCLWEFSESMSQSSSSSGSSQSSNPPPTHRMFDTVELVDIICSHLTPSSLVAFAMTSRQFLPPVLGQLYRTMKTPAFSSLISNFASKSSHSWGMDVERFALYSKPVRELDLLVPSTTTTESWFQKLPIVVIKSISLPIFPSLLTITAMLGNNQLITLLLLLTGDLPSLNSLTIKSRSFFDHQELTGLADVLPTRCRNLQRLEIYCLTTGSDSPSTSVSMALSKALHKLARLEHLSLRYVNLDLKTMRSLSRHPNLSSLSLSHSHADVEGLTSVDDGSVAGPLPLRKLDLSVKLSKMPQVLAAFPADLEHLKLIPSTTAAAACTSRQIESFANTFSRFPRLVLLEVNLTTTAKRGSTGGHTPISYILDSLAVCYELRELRIYTNSDISAPRDEDIERAAASWPFLRSFRLAWRLSEHRPTLRSLHSLGYHCPHLSCIELTELFVDDKGYMPKQANMNAQGLHLEIWHLRVHNERLNALAALVAGTWPAVKIRTDQSPRTQIICL